MIKQEQKQPMEDKVYLWTLGNQTIISRMENQNVLIVKYIDTQYEAVRNQRKRKTLGNAMSIEKLDTLPRTVGQR